MTLIIGLAMIQEKIRQWNDKNFPKGTSQDCLVGVMEELGELSHAHLKMRQGIRGTEKKHRAAQKDAVGDICIFLMAYCAKENISIQDCIQTAWNEVSKRNWNNRGFK